MEEEINDQTELYFRSNNWLKVHGYPMRRKPQGKSRKRLYREKSVILMKKIENLTNVNEAINQVWKYMI